MITIRDSSLTRAVQRAQAFEKRWRIAGATRRKLTWTVVLVLK